MSKRHYSYFLIKPDGIRFIDELCDEIEERYQSVRYYAVEDFEEIIKKLYHKHYEEKGEKFANSFDSYLYGLKELFGNQTIMALIADGSISQEELMKSIYRTKIELRNRHTNNNIGIITNHGTGTKNYVRFISADGVKSLPRIMEDLGNHRISNMNIIHSPDPNLSVTLEELNILVSEGIIDDKNLINADIMNKIRKYKTVRFQDDTKEPGYIGEAKPDISGFVKMEIKRLEDSYR